MKAAWMVKFLKYVHWPVEEMDSDFYVIGILGSESFDEAFKPVMGKKVANNRELKIKPFGRYTPGLQFTDCHLLYISPSEQRHMGEIMKALEGSHILTVSELNGFIDNEGMINFIFVGDQLRYEVNQAAARNNKLRITSPLLKRAVRVIRKRGSLSQPEPGRRGRE